MRTSHLHTFAAAGAIRTTLVVIGCGTSTLLLAPFFYLLPVHLAAFAVAITGVIIADTHALWWVRGLLPTLPAARIYALHDVVAGALTVAVVSGVTMFWPLRTILLSDIAFLFKLFFVITLILNSVVIHRHLYLACTTPFAHLPRPTRVRLLVSGAVSTAGWIGTFITAQLLAV